MPAPSRSPTLQSERTPSLRESGDEARDQLARAIPRRARVSWWVGLLLAAGFAALVAPAITAERWPLQLRAGTITAGQPAPFTVRAPMLGGGGKLGVRGGVVIARGETASREQAAIADAIAEAMPRGPIPYLVLFGLSWALAAIFTHHVRRSSKGRLLRVQIVSLAAIAAVAVAAKLVLLSTAASALVVPVAALAIVPTIALDRVVGLATGVLAAVVVSLLAPFDVGLAILLVVQAATAGLVIGDRPRRHWLAALIAGLAAALCTAATYFLLPVLITGTTGTASQALDLRDLLHSPWLAAAIGPVLAGVLAVPLLPLYQRLVGDVTRRTLLVLEDLGHPLLRQIAERAPGTWQHSLMMANMAEIAANAIGANGRLVRVGAYFHDLGKSLQPKYFIENLEPGETSPHDRLPPEVSCDAIFAHVAGGIAAARKAHLHERIVDFVHMHHGDRVLEQLWARCQEQGNPNAFTVERFRYPGHPPQSRETAILAICDALEVASRTLHRPDTTAIDALVQRVVHGTLDLGQLDDSGLSMADLRRISDSLRETIRRANRDRIEYSRHASAQDASASATAHTVPLPQLDSPDAQPARYAQAAPLPARNDDALAATADLKDSGERQPPGAHAARTASEPNETRIRAGTARNAHAAPPDDGRSGREPLRTEATRNAHAAPPDDGREPLRAEATHAAPPDADRPREAVRAGNDVVTIVPRRRASDRPRAPSEDASMSPLDDAPTHGREPSTRPNAPAPRNDKEGSAHAAMTTLPGRAPGPKPRSLPLPPAPELITPAAFGNRPVSTQPLSTQPLSTQPLSTQPLSTQPLSTQPLSSPPLGSQPLPVAIARTGTPPSRHPRPPTSPPVMPARAPTADPTRAADPTRTADATRTAGPPSPSTLENAITDPPPLRRAPGGPSVPVDPAQIAAALAAIVSRVSGAPFGVLRSPEGRPPTATPSSGIDQTITPAPPVDDDARVTLPRMSTQPAGTDPSSVAGRASVASSPDLEARGTDAGRATAPHVDTRVTDPRGAAAPLHLDTHVTDPRSAAAPLHVDTHVSDPRGAAAPLHLDTRVTDPRSAATAPDFEARTTDERPAAFGVDAGSTEPSMPMLDIGDERSVELSPAPLSPPRSPEQDAAMPWSSALAARVDAALVDEWGNETPVVAPTSAELRVLFGQPDPTRQLPVDEVELLQRRAAELAEADRQRRVAELADAGGRRRAPPPTAEVDPEDIEAAIELAPPARRPVAKNTIGVNRPKKSE